MYYYVYTWCNHYPGYWLFNIMRDVRTSSLSHHWPVHVRLGAWLLYILSQVQIHTYMCGTLSIMITLKLALQSRTSYPYHFQLFTYTTWIAISLFHWYVGNSQNCCSVVEYVRLKLLPDSNTTHDTDRRHLTVTYVTINLLFCYLVNKSTVT